MRKFWVLFVCLFMVGIGLYADDGRPIRFDQLPEKAQIFVKTFFPQEKVTLVKRENDFFGKKYKVIFTNRSRIEFDKNGIWTNVDCRNSVVPSEIIPKAIKHHVQTHYPDQKVVQIEKENRGYEVELSKGLSLEFDKNIRLIDIND
ncbi:MAG: PepSY-like domain-containing protein [Parabacteroides sp.]|nr:PepSY-like domain-containing protein [Parabacteroides sp.]